LKVCLVNPGVLEKPLHPPIGIMSIAAYLMENGIECDILDLGGERLDKVDIKGLLQDKSPDVVGITCYSGPWIRRAIKISKIARELGIPIVWGGPHPTTVPQQTLESGYCDVVVRGEGEITMLELVKVLEDDADLGKVKGISFLLNGSYVETPPRPLIETLDDLPAPAWHLLGNLEKYLREFYGRKAIPMVTSRGCPYRCAFCETKVMYGYRWRGRSAQKIVEEIKTIKSLCPKVGALNFADDNFAVDSNRVEEFCRVSREMDLYWSCDIRADQITDSMLHRMKEGGCRHIYIGLESGSERILEVIKKDINVDTILKAFNIAKNAGVKTTAAVMVNLPGETLRELKLTLDLIKMVNADVLDFSIYTPYPGTELYEMALRYGFNPPRTLEGWADIGPRRLDSLYHKNLTEIQADVLIRELRRFRRWMQIKSIVNIIKNPKTYTRLMNPKKAVESLWNIIKGSTILHEEL